MVQSAEPRPIADRRPPDARAGPERMAPSGSNRVRREGPNWGALPPIRSRSAGTPAPDPLAVVRFSRFKTISAKIGLSAFSFRNWKISGVENDGTKSYDPRRNEVRSQFCDTAQGAAEHAYSALCRQAVPACRVRSSIADRTCDCADRQ